ncbi:amino acid ABC transporter permease [Ornithinimicrobium faecis]|uniref:Amino acid ABC transporter permease n=1 Tax=Ornithinimicrobium faecis TaxID=2934158 RepID=A0ABY4YRE5_9MICO|nr:MULTISPECIES: amino acid ABC transporter permease [unclassified Ornithinimicrobium]USQ78948.1 amino acid ABC transporter permease [Ornithinimicrobium sp. HY1793]
MSDFFEGLTTALPRLLGEGLQATLISFAGGAVLMVIVAVLLGVAGHQGPGWLQVISRVIVEFFRGTSLVVQLFFIFYAIPTLTGVDLGSMWSAIIGLGLNYGAYGAEVVRGSLNAVPKGQWETTTALSMPWTTKMRRVIWPQAWALMLPGLNNLTVMLIKGTAVVGLVLLSDLTFEADTLRRQVGTWPAFISALLIYYVIALVVSTIMRAMERRAQRKLGLGDYAIRQARKDADKVLAGAAAAGGSTGVAGGLGTTSLRDPDKDREERDD